MKKYICIIGIAGLISLGSCENANKGLQDDEVEDEMMEADTSDVDEGLNNRGLPTEGLSDHNAIREDTMEVDTDHNAIMEELPAEVSGKIMADETLRDKKLTNSRRFAEGETTYYELTFDDGDRITFDERGNKSEIQ